jgi:CubicO group peptidase (beta-lactamase class C family)
MKKLILLLLFVPLVSFGQSSSSINEQLTQDLLSIYAQNHIVGFSVAIVNQDKILYTKGFGYSDKLKNKAYTENTIQNIASISKTFIGISLLKAQELGKLNLDDPINNYLPFEVINPKFPNTAITIRHLATHTSSIIDPSRYGKNGYVLKEINNNGKKINSNFRPSNELMTYDEFLKKILSKYGEWYKKKYFLKKKPGTFFSYSNIGAGLAALVIENAVGKPFNLFTKEYIFEPLKMSSTGWFSSEVDFTNHTKLYANTKTELAFYNLVNYPDGGLITSSNDLGKYLIELISGYNENGLVLSKESYNELYTPKLNNDIHINRSSGTYNDEYNMGVFMGMSSKRQIGHTGGDPGVATLMFFNSETKIGKILFVNTDLKKERVEVAIDIWRKLEEYENKF